MPSRKPAPRAAKPKTKPKPPAAVRTLRKELGMVQRPDGSFGSRAADYATHFENRFAAMGNPYPTTYAGSTPFGQEAFGTGIPVGSIDNLTGKVTITGAAPGAGPARSIRKPKPKAGEAPRSSGGRPGTRRKPKPKGRGGGTADKGLDQPLTHAESDLSTTSYLRTQGKAYAAGRGGSAASLAGSTGRTKTGEAEESSGGGKKKPRKRKGLLKTRGHRQQSGVKANFHINKAGKVVPNKGGRKAKPKGK